jgi:hypothetical protein
VIEKYLEDLERRIEPQVEKDLWGQWRAFAGGRHGEEIFLPQRPRMSPPSLAWPHVLVNDALEDNDAMALQQLELCSKALAEGSGAILAVRCNYGTAILPSLFGGRVFLMDRDIDTLPACRPLDGGAKAVRRLLDRGAPDLEAGLGAKTFRMGDYFGQLFQPYPHIARHVHIYHPDLQGPMNVCEMLWGSSLYLDLYDQPELVRDFLTLITETYIRFLRRWEKEMAVCSVPARACRGMGLGAPFPPMPHRQDAGATETPGGVATNYAVHWSMLHRGRIMVRNDAATNLSPAMYEEFARPFDQRLLTEFGGGAIHFCGRGDHLLPSISQLSGLHALNMTQPALNDVETILSQTVDKQINLLGFDRPMAEGVLQQGRPLHGRVHCW